MRLLDEHTRDSILRTPAHAVAGGQGYEVNPNAYASDGVDRRRGDLPEAPLSLPGEATTFIRICWRRRGDREQVWSTDITYIRLAQGFVYLVR